MTAHDASDVAARPAARVRALQVLLGCVLPVAIAVLGAVLASAWGAQLTAPVAVHWGPQGADQFAQPGSVPTVGWGVAGIVALLSILGTWWSLRPGQAALTRRMSAASVTCLATLWSAIWAGVIWVQRPGASDPAQPGPVFLLSFGVAIALAVAVALLIPADPPELATDAVPDDAARLPLSPGSRAVWTERLHNRAPLWAVGAAAVVCVAVGVVSRIDTWAFGLLALIICLLLVAAAQFTTATVTIDERGLIVRGGLGRVMQRVPLDEVESATVVQVSPLREFGGWGVRTALSGRVGVVMSAGPGIEIERSGGRRLVVTASGAAQGAALLNALVARSRGH